MRSARSNSADRVAHVVACVYRPVGVAVELFAVLRSVSKFTGTGYAVSTPLIFAYSLPILLSGLISFGASSADRFIVSGLLNLSSLGIYNFALLISNSIGLFALPFTNILMPKFSEYYGRGMKSEIAPFVRVSSTLLSTLYVPAALGVAALSPAVLHLLAGSQYESGALALRIVMFSTAIFVTQSILSQAIASVRLTRVFLYSSILSFLSNMVLSFLLIPRFGLTGAAIGYSSVFATVFAILWFFAKKYEVGSLDIKGLLKIWGASLSMFVLLMLLQNRLGADIEMLPIYIALGTLAFLSFAKILNIFNKTDKELVLSLFPLKFSRTRKLITLLILH